MQKQLLSPRFLQRISSYPEDVQSALQSPVSRSSLEHVLKYFHGSPEVPEGTLAGTGDTLLDTVLGKIVVSKRFLARVDTFFEALALGHDVDTFLSAEVLSVLGDPSYPYVWKMREVAANAPTLREQGSSLLPFLEILTIQHSLDRALIDIAPATQADFIAELIVRAGEGGEAAKVLDWTLAVVAPKMRFARSNPTPTRPALNFISQRLRFRIEGGLTAADRIALRVIESQVGAAPQLDLQLRAQLVTGPETHDPELVAALIAPFSAAAPTQGILTLQAGMTMSRIAAAWLACATLPPKTGVKLQCLAAKAVHGSWAKDVQGYTFDEASAVDVGTYQCGAHAVQEWISLPFAVPDLDLKLQVEPTLEAVMNAYALLVMLEGAELPDRYVNVENCVIFNSFEALTAAVEMAGPRACRKPVIVLGPTTPEESALITSAVGAYWSYGAKHSVAFIDIEYDGGARSFTVHLPKETELRRFGALHAMVLPAQIVALDPAGRKAVQRAVETGVFVLRDHVIVSRNIGLQISGEAIPRLQQSLARGGLSPAESEELHLAGHSDHDWIAQVDATHNWAVEALISRSLNKERDLRRKLREFIHAPCLAAAVEIAATLGEPSPASIRLQEEVAPFLTVVFQHPEIMLELSEAAVGSLIAQARSSGAADIIGDYLAAYAHRLCSRQPSLILPLFEFLVCSTNGNVLQTVLGMTIAQGSKSRRFLFRLGEAVRRYGSSTSLLMFLERMVGEKGALENQTQLRIFQGLIGSGKEILADNIAAPGFMKRVEATLTFPDLFRIGLSTGHRDGLFAMIASAELDPDVSFMKWMDDLRGFSNELRAMNLAVADIPGIRGLLRRKLAAVLMSDSVELERFRANGLLNRQNDLSAVAHNILGDNRMVNAMIATRCDAAGVAPYRLAGDSITQVFAAARESIVMAGGATVPSDANGPMVSVIVSAFNPDISLLRMSVASILEQTHKNIEILIVDDASEDSLGVAIQSLASEDRRITYIRVPENSGPYFGRNLAIERARGEFIAIQDADDWSHPQRFTSQLSAFAENDYLQLVTSAHIRIDRSGCIQMEEFFRIFGDGPMSSMFRRGVFDEIGRFAEVRSRGDIEMRERIRSYYGGHCIEELQMPAMLCFADSGTLSQKTKTSKLQALQLLRSNIGRRPSLAQLRRRCVTLSADSTILIPRDLRVNQEKAQ